MKMLHSILMAVMMVVLVQSTLRGQLSGVCAVMMTT